MTDPVALFHIVSAGDWRAARDSGSYEPESLAAQGFVHFSHLHQVAGVANRFYRQLADPIVVEFDPSRLGNPVVEEDLYDAGEVFPHVYAAIPTAAAVAEHALDRSAAGDYVFSG